MEKGKHKPAANLTKEWSKEAEEVAERLAEIFIMQIEKSNEKKEK